MTSSHHDKSYQVIFRAVWVYHAATRLNSSTRVRWAAAFSLSMNKGVGCWITSNPPENFLFG
jgi:hypothetical protein